MIAGKPITELSREKFAKELEAIGKREHDPPFDPKVFRFAKVINDHAYGEGTSIRYYVSDGYGDVTKSVSGGPYGRLSASEGNWL